MWNVLLDPLPEEWNGYPIDTDFQTGIQISQCLEDDMLSTREQIITALTLLFPDKNNRPNFDDAQEALDWYMTDFCHDNYSRQKSKKRSMDFDIDQWRIYAAFLSQYGIDLNTTKMHWFVFMGLLGNLEECSYSRVIDVRLKEFNNKMTSEERKYYTEAKKIYEIGAKEQSLTEEEKALDTEALEVFNRLRNKT